MIETIGRKHPDVIIVHLLNRPEGIGSLLNSLRTSYLLCGVRAFQVASPLACSKLHLSDSAARSPSAESVSHYEISAAMYLRHLLLKVAHEAGHICCSCIQLSV